MPVALAEVITGRSFQDSLFALLYSKTLLFVFLIFSAIIVKKIALELQINETNAKWAAFMFLTSGFVFSYICIAGQYDIMGIFFSLAGVYFYLKNDMKKFGFLFVIAVQYKFFPLFIFFPLLLLRIKNIIKIIAYVTPPVIAVIIFRLPFLNDIAILEKNEINADMLDRIFRNRIPIFETEVPLSFLLVGAVCIYCYFKEVRNINEDRYLSIYIPFLSLSVLFLAFPFYPYWIIYITPWVPLLYFMRKELREKYFWIEAGMSVGIILAQFSHFEWVFELYNTRNMLLNVLYGYDDLTNPITIFEFVTLFKITEFEYLFYGLYILCLVTMLILYRPQEKIEYKDNEFPARTVLWIRFGIQYAVGALPFLLFILSIFREWIFY